MVLSFDQVEGVWLVLQTLEGLEGGVLSTMMSTVLLQGLVWLPFFAATR